MKRPREILILAGLLFVLAALPAFRKRREKIVSEAEELG